MTFGFYGILAFISILETRDYMKKNNFVSTNKMLSSRIAPSISIIAPAHNESLHIVENVRSLLSNYYANYDVILINDGSTDDSLNKLIEAYELIKVECLYNEHFKTKPIRNGFYKSKNPAFEKLIVVDKENGGKADALNMGLNISKSKYVVSVDVDSLLLEKALQKMIQYFLSTSDVQVIAAGSVIRISNSCEIKDGKLMAVNLPEKLIEKGQILEYLRAFLLGRMAWSRVNALMVISGALGLFEKKILIDIGGYDTNTVGEDMEIIVRMKKYMRDRNLKYKIAYIPDPLCWTEAPDNNKTFISQRNRWARGTIETLRKHRKVGFNPKYKSMGLISYPYWFLFERMAPIMEVLGLLYFGILLIREEIRWDYAISYAVLAYLCIVLFSITAILSEEFTFHQYKRKRMGFKLLLVAFIEPFYNHPLIVYASIRGNIDYYFNPTKKWGIMLRTGNAKKEIERDFNPNYAFPKVNFSLNDSFRYANLTFALILVFFLIRFYEMNALLLNGIEIHHFGTTLLFKIINDFWTGILIGILFTPVYFTCIYFKKPYAETLIKVLFSLIVFGQFCLTQYSITTYINLGADVLGYSLSDMFITVSASESISIFYFIPFIVFPMLYFGMNYTFNKYIKTQKNYSISFFSIIALCGIKMVIPDISNSRYQNKIYYLTAELLRFEKDKNQLDVSTLVYKKEYPLVKPIKESKDVLSPFFNINDTKPNIVFIIVEGLGGEFIGENEYNGFTPYLDSLIPKSLYWENFLSNTGRTFGVLPSLLGSLPYGEKGFLELNPLPAHISLFSVLKANEYTTSYYSGDESSFDRKINFLEYNGIDSVIDENKFGSNYIKTKENSGGFTWGYPDSEIFKKTLSEINSKKQPRLDVIMTLTNHEPFDFPTKNKYLKKVDSLFVYNAKLKVKKSEMESYKDIFACLSYTDNSIKNFMAEYAKRPDYKNTIFIITGDHRLIPIPQKDKLCRFHVPLILFSPMLKKPETFQSISSHWDVTPSLLSFLMNNYNFNPIEATTWMGSGLDTAKEFRNIHNIPLMRNKGNLNDFIYKEYFYSDGELFKINKNFETKKINDEAILKTISDSLNKFKKLNAYLTQKNKIIPDYLNVYSKPTVQFSKSELITLKKLTGTLNYDEIFNLARDFAFNKNYPNALLLCDYTLNELPNYADVRTLKGRILAWEGKYENAEIELESVLKRTPYYEDSYLALMDLYWWSNQNQKAIITAKKAKNNNIKNIELSLKLAEAYKRMDAPKKALHLIDSILKIHPNNTAFINLKKSIKK